MAKRCIVTSTLSALHVVVVVELLIVLYDIVRGVDQCVPQGSGAAFGHSGPAGVEIARLTDHGIQPGIGQKLVVVGETVDITDFTQDHPGFNVTDTGDGHDDGAHGFYDLFDLGFGIINLSIQ